MDISIRGLAKVVVACAGLSVHAFVSSQTFTVPSASGAPLDSGGSGASTTNLSSPAARGGLDLYTVPQITNPSSSTPASAGLDRGGVGEAAQAAQDGAGAIQRGPQAAAGAQARQSEFQRFVREATGRRLGRFGERLFDPAATTFAPIDRVPVPADYVLGPGDELHIRAWGAVDIDYRATIDRNGLINIPRVGSVRVAGLKASEVEDYLDKQVARVFRNFSLNVTLGQLRSIQIFIVGQAQRPGSYTVGSLSTLVNAVFASGGPSPRGC